MNKSQIEKLIAQYKERNNDNYFKLEWRKYILRLVYRGWCIFLYNGFPESLVWHLLPYRNIKVIIGQNKFGIFFGDGMVLWQENFGLFCLRFSYWQIYLDLFWFTFCWFCIFSCRHLSNDFYQSSQKLCPTKNII